MFCPSFTQTMTSHALPGELIVAVRPSYTCTRGAVLVTQFA